MLGFDAEWAAAHGGATTPAMLDVRAWYNPNLLSRWFVVPGIVGLLAFVVTILVSGLSVVRERESARSSSSWSHPTSRGRFARQGRAGPVDRGRRGGLIVAVAVVWFGVPLIGSLLALALGLVLFLVRRSASG